MSQVTALNRSDLTAAIEPFEVGEVCAHSLAANGIENSNYFVTTRPTTAEVSQRAANAAAKRRDSEFVLTILEQPSNTPSSVYLTLMDTCVAAGLPVPQVLRGSDDEAFQSILGKTALLSKRLNGAHVSNPTAEQVAALGRFFARFHLATEPIAHIAPDYPRDIAWLEDQFDAMQSQLSFSARTTVRSAITLCRSAMQREDIQELPRGFIHGDGFRDNVLFNQRGLSGVLDFHHASGGFWLFDLAVIANDWCVDNDGCLRPDMTLALLRGYHGLRPLKQAEMWWLPIFSIYAATVFATSRFVGALQAKADGRRSKDPEELLRVLRSHLLHPLQLDWRLLT